MRNKLTRLVALSLSALLALALPVLAAYNGSGLSAPSGVTLTTPNPVWPVITLEMFQCVPNTQSVDNTSCINNALTYLANSGGGELKVSNNYFYYNGSVQLLGNNITVDGTGYNSSLLSGLSGTFTVGTAVNVGGNKTGTDVLFPKFTNVSFAAVANYSGPIVQILQGEHIDFDTVNISVASNNGSTQTDGLFLKWVQYVMVRNLHTFVNGYAVHVYLDSAIPQNEDHYSFDDSWLYLSDTPKSGTYPAGIAIQRISGRVTNIGQFESKSTHFLDSTVGGPSTNSRGVLVINEMSGSQTRVLETSAFVGDMFELVNTGFDAGTLAANDTSTFGTYGSYFLNNAGNAFLGSGVFDDYATARDDRFLGVGTICKNIRCEFSGFNNPSGSTNVSNNSLSFNRYESKSGAGSLIGTVLQSTGTQNVGSSDTSATITHGLSATPSSFQIVPSWPTTFYITNITSTQFTVNFTPPGSPGFKFYWVATVADQ